MNHSEFITCCSKLASVKLLLEKHYRPNICPVQSRRSRRFVLFLPAGSISTEVCEEEFSNKHKDSVLLVGNIHSWCSSGCLSHLPIMCKTPWRVGVASKASTVFEGSVVGPLLSFLLSVFEKQKQTERSISATSGAGPPPPLLHPHPCLMLDGCLWAPHPSNLCSQRGRKSDKFPRPSLATGIRCCYWAFEMVRVWSCDMPGQWNVVGGKMGLGEF